MRLIKTSGTDSGGPQQRARACLHVRPQFNSFGGKSQYAASCFPSLITLGGNICPFLLLTAPLPSAVCCSAGLSRANAAALAAILGGGVSENAAPAHGRADLRTRQINADADSSPAHVAGGRGRSSE